MSHGFKKQKLETKADSECDFKRWLKREQDSNVRAIHWSGACFKYENSPS